MKLSNNQVNQHLNLVAPAANKGYEAVLRHTRLIYIKKLRMMKKHKGDSLDI